MSRSWGPVNSCGCWEVRNAVVPYGCSRGQELTRYFHCILDMYDNARLSAEPAGRRLTTSMQGDSYLTCLVTNCPATGAPGDRVSRADLVTHTTLPAVSELCICRKYMDLVSGGSACISDFFPSGFPIKEHTLNIHQPFRNIQSIK